MKRYLSGIQYKLNDWFIRFGRRGPGISMRPLKDHKVLFSERNKHHIAIHILGVCIQILRKW